MRITVFYYLTKTYDKNNYKDGYILKILLTYIYTHITHI